MIHTVDNNHGMLARKEGQSAGNNHAPSMCSVTGLNRDTYALLALYLKVNHKREGHIHGW